MTSCFVSVLGILFLCYIWGAWLQYNTDAQQGQKTTFDTILSLVTKLNTRRQLTLQSFKSLIDSECASIFLGIVDA